jgi:hypothetical protein
MRANPRFPSPGSVAPWKDPELQEFFKEWDKRAETTTTTKISLNPSTEQIGGAHYKKLKIQVWDFVIANNLDYFQGSIVKYVTRWRDKGWIEDLYKARHFLDKYIETMETQYAGLKERPEKTI